MDLQRLFKDGLFLSHSCSNITSLYILYISNQLESTCTCSLLFLCVLNIFQYCLSSTSPAKEEEARGGGGGEREGEEEREGEGVGQGDEEE